MSNDRSADKAAKPPLQGALGVFTPTLIKGWVRDPTTPDDAVELELLIDDVTVGQFSANVFRADVMQAMGGHGRYGFEVTVPRGFSRAHDHIVRLRHAVDGRELSGSPRTLPAEPEAQPQGLTALAEAIEAEAAAGGPAADAMLGTLAETAVAVLLAQGSAVPTQAAVRLARFSRAALPLPMLNGQKLALVIDEGTPVAERDAGSNAILSHMRALQRLGYAVQFVSGYSVEPMGEQTQALEAIGVTCWTAPWIGSVEEVLRALGPALKLVYLHRFAMVQRYGGLVRLWCPGTRLIYCVADLHHLRAARQLAVEAGGSADAPLWSDSTVGLRIAELTAIEEADVVLTHSRFEADYLRREVPNASVQVVPWDVPVVSFAAPIASRRGVAFVGSYGHPPNVDAAYVLLERVMPLVWAEAPDIPLLLAGSDLPASLRAAADGLPEARVHMLGWVATLGEVFSQVRMTAAPLRYGAGVKGKVLDSLAAGLPCVCSPIAAEGMNLPGTLSPLVGTSEEEIAAIILRLHADDTACIALSAAAQRWVSESFSPMSIDALLAVAVGCEVGAGCPPSEPAAQTGGVWPAS